MVSIGEDRYFPHGMDLSGLPVWIPWKGFIQWKKAVVVNEIPNNSGKTADSVIFWSMLLCLAALPVSTSAALFPFALAGTVAFLTGRFSIVKNLIRQKWVFPAVMFVLLPWLGLLYSKDMPVGWDYALKTKYWAAMLIMAGVRFTPCRIHLFFMGFWLTMLAGTLAVLLQAAGILGVPAKGYLGFGLVYTVLSMYLVIGILTASHYFRYSENWKAKTLYLVFMAAFLFHLSMLEGRNGYFVFILVSPLVLHNLMGQKHWGLKILLALLIIGSLGFSPKVVHRVKVSLERLHRTDIIMTGKMDDEFSRPYIFHSALRALKEHPVMGAGTGSFVYYTRPGGDAVTHPHNSVLHMAVSFGIPGVVCILWLFWTMFRVSFAHRQEPLGFLVLSVCLVIFFGGIFETPILNAGTCLLFPMAFGCLAHLQGPASKEKNL